MSPWNEFHPVIHHPSCITKPWLSGERLANQKACEVERDLSYSSGLHCRNKNYELWEPKQVDLIGMPYVVVRLPAFGGIQTEMERSPVETARENISVVRGRWDDIILRTILMLRFLGSDSVTGCLKIKIWGVCVCVYSLAPLIPTIAIWSRNNYSAHLTKIKIQIK